MTEITRKSILAEAAWKGKRNESLTNRRIFCIIIESRSKCAFFVTE